MNKYTVLWIVAVLVVAFSYFFLMDHDDAGHTRALQAEVATTSEVEMKMEEMAATLRQLSLSHQALVEESRNQRSRLNDAVASLEERIRSADVIQPKQNELLIESNDIAQVSALESGGHDLPNVETHKVSERKMSRWMDEMLSSGYLDDAATVLASEQLESSIANTPGMQIVAMLCSERFCRASLAMEDGKAPDIGNLLGVPPFVNEGFSVNEPDGTVTVYFTDDGVSMSDLRVEASQEQMNYN